MGSRFWHVLVIPVVIGTMLAGCAPAAPSPTVAPSKPAAAPTAAPAAPTAAPAKPTAAATTAPAKPTAAATTAPAKPTVAPTTAAAAKPTTAPGKPANVLEIPLGLANVNLTNPGYIVGTGLGTFERYGSKPLLTLTQNSTTAVQGLLAQSLGVAAVTTDATILAQVKAPDLVMVMPITVKWPLSLVASPGIKTPADLKGKVLGASSPKTGDAYFIRTVLALSGLQDEKDYTIVVSGDPTGRIEALRKGAISGIALVEPQVSQLKAEGMVELIRGGNIPSFAKWPQIYLVTTRTWAKAHEEALVRYLRGSLEGNRITFDPARKAEVIKTISEQLKIDPKYVESAYQNWVVEQQAFSKDGSLSLEGIQTVINGLIDTGDLQAPGPKPADLIDASYAQKALQLP